MAGREIVEFVYSNPFLNGETMSFEAHEPFDSKQGELLETRSFRSSKPPGERKAEVWWSILDALRNSC